MKIGCHLLFFLLPISLFTQNSTFRCGYDELQAQLQVEHPDMMDKQEVFEEAYQQYVRDQKTSTSRTSVTLPVVIHVVHLDGTPIGEEENLTDEDVRLGLDRLNDAFAGVACGSNPMGSDMQINFELARRDIHGEATSGIVRHSSHLSVFGVGGYSFMIFDVVGFNSPFPTTEYINIYLVKSICFIISGGECSGPLGLATSAASHGFITDGIAIEAGIWSNEDACMSGKLAAHEMGHYLNLLHTFQNGCENDNCLTQGDKICDTAPDNIGLRSNAACLDGTPNNSCATDTNDDYCNPFSSDENDPEDNIMDYSPFPCQYLFTEGQRIRMHATIQTTRKSILESQGFSDPCTLVTTTNFFGKRDVLQDSVEIYQSNAENADSIAWLVDGMFISNDATLSYNFPDIAEHTLTLQAFNNGGCMTESNHLINVYQTNCNLTATLDEIPPLCHDIFGNGFVRLNAVPSGGQWQDENGVIISGTIRNELYINGRNPGTYPLYYTLREGWCQQTFETEFTILENNLSVEFSERINCDNTPIVPITMSIHADNFGYWRDNQAYEQDFSPLSIDTITNAGTYHFSMFSQSGECQLNFEVPSSNNSSVQIKECDDCLPYVNLCIEGAPDHYDVNWFGGYPFNPGRWEAMVIDNHTGCESWAKLETTSLENKMPNCSAGSSSGISCGGTMTLLGAVTSNEGDIEYWWTTTDGNIVSGAKTLTPTIDRPGQYVLHVRNPLYGCENSDIITIAPLTRNIEIDQTICFGESYEGYSETGMYVDTFTYGCDCDSIRTINLTVSQTNITAQITPESANTNNGNIELIETNGASPFTYLWSTGDTTQNLENLSSDNYALTITDFNGCETTFDFYVDQISSNNSLRQEIDISVSPNPIRKGREVSISMKSNQNGNYNISIHDMLGKAIQRFEHRHVSPSSLADFSLHSTGLYIIYVEDKKGRRQVLQLIVSD